MIVTWRIEMLGGLTAVQGDRKISRFQTQKTGALLAYLALHPGKSHSREAMAEILWPDGDPIAIRNRLNQAISSLRRQLHPPELGPGQVLVTDHHSIGVSSQTVTSDVEDFEKEIRRAESADSDEHRVQLLSQAVDRYRGELLEGYYEEWVFSKRMHLADLYDKALQQLIRSYVALGSPDRAIEYARRRLQLDPYDESPHVILMRLYLRSGRPKSALKQFEDLVRALQQFDDEPSENALKYKSKAEALANDQAVESDLDEDFEDAPVRKASPVSAVPSLEQVIQLPRIVSSFVGREDELRDIQELIRIKEVRLISILGLGGSGKTRLAIEVGWSLVDEFQSRVFFVSLANLEDGKDLPDEIARQVVPNQANLSDSTTAIVERLSSLPSSLLILDNFEHLAESSSQFVSDLMARVPFLYVIVTTRIPLSIEGESLISLSPLPLPEESSVDLCALAANPVISLFVDRAQAVKADFQLTERTAEAIVELGRKLEGLPLAIELAASWARVLTPAQMLEQVNTNVDKLASRRKDINPRHRSVRAAFDGSFQLLDDALRDVFLRLCSFSGGWDFDAAQHVCPVEDVILAIQQLEERSLIFSEPTDRALRFSMLEMTRSFGESMASPDLAAECGWLHAEYFRALAEQRGPYSTWVLLIEPDYANCLAALRWLKEQGRVEGFARMTVGLARYWEGRGLLSEGKEWLQKAFDLGTIVDPILHARAEAEMASLDWLAGDFELAVERTNAAIKLFQTYNARQNEMGARFLLQLEAHRKGDYAEVQNLLSTNLSISRELEDAGAESRCWLALGNAAIEMDDFEAAQGHYEKSLETARVAQEDEAIGSALTNLANLAIYRSQTDAARKWLDDAREIMKASDRRWKMAMTMIVMGRLENEVGNYREAAQTLIQAYWTAKDEKLVVWRFLLQFGFALAGLEMLNEAFRMFGFLERYREKIGEHHRGIEMRSYELGIQKIGLDRNREQFEIGRNMSLEEIEVLIAKVQRSF
ncbi:MAG: winged helix-turn-helix domain-containing protein [Chlorobia bacterium]|nr:winged helix-turn-helix domain-containing protein [Fimbriimonadaceae bacterium]